MTKRWTMRIPSVRAVLLTIIGFALPTMASGDPPAWASIGVNLIGCAGGTGAWVRYWQPYGEQISSRWVDSTGSYDDVLQCSNGGGCERYETYYNSFAAYVVRHEVWWSYYGEEPPEISPYYIDSGCL